MQVVLKIRLQGTKKDIRWYLKALNRDPRYELDYISDFMQCKGTEKFHRVYVNLFRHEKRKKIEN